jgi:aminoglycoside 3-N-acetyltransferase
MPETDQEKAVLETDIGRGLSDLGVECGSVLVVHSSLSSFGYVQNGAEGLIKALTAHLTDRGTLLMPAFVQRVNGQSASYEDRRRVWDIDHTPSDVGLVTETFRKMPGVVRSDHPTDSFCAWGRGARDATQGHATAHGRPSPWDDRCFGVGSPWEWILDHDAHYVLMGVDFGRCSMLHFAQALYAERVGLYDETPPKWPRFDFVAVGRILEQQGLVQETTVGTSRWLHIRSKTLVDESLMILEADPDLIRPIPIAPYLSERWIEAVEAEKRE